MDDELTAPQMQKLLGLSRQALSALVRDGIIVRAERRGRYKLESVPRYCEHLRQIGAGRGSDVGADARARLGTAQAALAEAKAAQLRGELVEASAVEAFWKRKLIAFRNRVLAVPSRVRDLSARQNLTLTQELRAALAKLGES